MVYRPSKMASLEKQYRQILADLRLTDVSVSEASLEEAFDAMWKAGWVHGHKSRDEALAARRSHGTNCVETYNPLLHRLAEEVESDITSRGGRLECNVFVGGLPIAEVNACIRRAEGGAIILVSHAALHLVYQLAKLYVLSYDWIRCLISHDNSQAWFPDPAMSPTDVPTFTDIRGWKQMDWTVEKTVKSIVAILRAHRESNLTNAPRTPLPCEQARAFTLESYVRYAERFLLSHEYSHLLLGHLEQTVQLTTQTGSIKDVFAVSQKMESNADQMAVYLLFANANQADEFDFNARAAGIGLFFVADVLLNLPLQGANSLDLAADGTHPSGIARLIDTISFAQNRFGFTSSILVRVIAGWLFHLIPLVLDELVNGDCGVI